MIDQTWANTIIQCCIRHGIDHFFVAPGSRCTPLTLAIARHSESIRVVQHFDERGLAFATLGFAKGSGRPGVFVCTSGTAVANAFPAVIEASVEKIPMLLFTADRPSELHGTGANQTIDQVDIFGGYPELFLNMPVPGDAVSAGDPGGNDILLKAMGRALDAATSGPVHLNWMFREPFTVNDVVNVDRINNDEVDGTATEFLSNRVVGEFDATNVKLKGNVLIALGTCTTREAQQAVDFARRLNCPLLSDVTSGLRAGSFELPSEFDLPIPDTILHLGGRIVSKTWLQWINKISDNTKFVHVTPSGQTFNPMGLKQDKLTFPMIELEHRLDYSKTSDSFRLAWEAAAKLRDEIVSRELFDTDQFCEPAVAFHISKNCPPTHGLFVGNSMPIRDMDWFGVSESGTARLVTANRGASGIDGLIATATGYARGLDRPTTLILGDLSALHDLNSLALLAKSPQPLIVLIVNNHGGHIFDLLPVNKSVHFEKYFATPHTIQFQNAATMFGIDYCCTSELKVLTQSYCDALSRKRSMIIELIIERAANIQVRQTLKDKIRQCSVQS